MRKGEVDSAWGWMVVVAAACNRIVIYGVSYSAGIVYVAVLEVFHESSGITSWISSLITAVVFFTCPLSGYLIRRFGERKVSLFGGLVAAIGMTSSAFVNSVPALILTYGIVAGLGCGFAFMPGSVAVAKYFKRKRNLAMGFASAGGGIGSFMFPPIIEYINQKYTWRGMFLILGGVTLNILVFGALFRPLKKSVCADGSQESGYSSDVPSKAEDDLEESHEDDRKIESQNLTLNENTQPECNVSFISRHFYLKIPSFYILMLNNFLFMFGASIIYGHLQAYSVYELKFSKSNAALLYTISGVMVLVFKLLHGILSSFQNVKIFRPIYLYIFSYFLGGIATFGLLLNSITSTYIYSLVFGMCYAACGGSLIPALLIDIAGVDMFGITYGVVLMAMSFGQLIGAPIAGVMYDKSGSYDTAFILAGSAITLSAILMIYPLRTDLHPTVNSMDSDDIELSINEIESIEENDLEIFDPISVSMVKGSKTSLHHFPGHSIQNLQNSEKYSKSSHGLNWLYQQKGSFESLDIQPRSNSFSGGRQHAGGYPKVSYKQVQSPLAMEKS